VRPRQSDDEGEVTAIIDMTPAAESADSRTSDEK
jgi:hypothetical protein